VRARDRGAAGRLFAPAAVGGAALLLIAALPPRAADGAFPQGPPLAHTGGFGEPGCHACHFDAEPNQPGGSLALSGLPGAYRAGETYRVTVSVEREGLAVGGFEVAARFAAGAQAGSFRALDEGVRVSAHPASGVQYAHQTDVGARRAEGGRAAWVVEWTAPESAAGPVVLHAAANAGDGDASQFGDFVYLDSVVVAPAP
jgi:hypothetical protein